MAISRGWGIPFVTGALLSGVGLLLPVFSRVVLPVSALKVALLLIAGGGLSVLAELSNHNWVRALLRAAFLPWLLLFLPWAVTFGSLHHTPMSRAGIIYWTIATACIATLLAVIKPSSIRAGDVTPER